MIDQEGAGEFFSAVRQLVAEGEVIYLPMGPAASLVTGVTGRWTSGGILRDVSSPGGNVELQDCQFFASIGGGFPGMMPGGGGFLSSSSAEGPEGFEKVFENSFGSLWKNANSIPKNEPSKAAVSLTALILLAGLGLALIALDLGLARDHRRPRLAAAAAALVAASICLLPLARSAVDQLRNPPEAPARSDGMPFGGPPPGFNPGGPDPGGMFEPPDVPEELQERYDQVQSTVFDWLGRGRDPRSFWSIEDEMRFRRHVELDETAEAALLLDQALKRLKDLEGNPPRAEDARQP
jgi:hypothetical protein